MKSLTEIVSGPDEANQGESQGPSVIYLLNAFPQLSETFILNEILHLQKKGIHVHVFSLARSGEAKVHRKAAALIDTTVYLSERRREEKIRALLSLILFHPIRLLRSAWFMTRQDIDDRLWTLKQAIYVASEARRLGARHIHAHFAVEAAEYAMVASMLSGVPYSMTGHAVDIYVRQRLLREKMNHAKFVVTVCDYNKRYLLEYNPAFPNDRLHVVHVGIDADLFSKEQSAQDHERGRGPLHITSIGRLVEKKGLRYLVEALGILKREAVNFWCTIVGEGPERATLERMVKESQLDSTVHLVGAQESERVKSILQSTDVFVLPCVIARNGDRDATPTVLLEAMAMGIPVVSTSVAGIPEMVGREAGILVAPGDARALARAIKDVAELGVDERAAMGKHGRRQVSIHFNVENEVQRLANLFLGRD